MLNWAFIKPYFCEGLKIFFQRPHFEFQPQKWVVIEPFGDFVLGLLAPFQFWRLDDRETDV